MTVPVSLEQAREAAERVLRRNVDGDAYSLARFVAALPAEPAITWEALDGPVDRRFGTEHSGDASDWSSTGRPLPAEPGAPRWNSEAQIEAVAQAVKPHVKEGKAYMVAAFALTALDAATPAEPAADARLAVSSDYAAAVAGAKRDTFPNINARALIEADARLAAAEAAVARVEALCVEADARKSPFIYVTEVRALSGAAPAPRDDPRDAECPACDWRMGDHHEGICPPLCPTCGGHGMVMGWGGPNDCGDCYHGRVSAGEKP